MAEKPHDWREVLGLRSPTEERNPRTEDVDRLRTGDLVRLMIAEDEAVLTAVRAVADQVTALVDLAVEALSVGGRIHYSGAGTSGRLAVLDAVELLPTYRVGPETVVPHLAGGDRAMMHAVEGVEDDPTAGAADLGDVGPADLVIGLAASGRTPYVGGALSHARERRARTALIATNPRAALAEDVDVAVLVDTGPEVITGSTRMKAGTAQKMVLNMFSTAVMVRLGKTYSNLMTEVAPTNQKLRARTVRMLVQATDQDPERCAEVLAAAGDARTALVALIAGIDVAQARELIAEFPPDANRIADPGGVRSAVAAARGERHG
ncbi:N-acetylmuramic acid 6-phosphate etherase [Occultella aeris]|uniref:N-acetylmuramic acid 6-phosphate etherase n=1 Tax=Occultella aeris TaxID=2761496 RepID=A0A7M4DMG8_9MICO|nr:N-acetylmuramic acid 6-phosphate etherase [Occultella aeris]VZO38578.1 N-acetylmuramic acid 6-phosphate etherase [Occultella aeris]